MISDLRRACGGLLFLVLGVAMAGSISCTRAELIGADLLANEASQVAFTDTVALHCRMTTEEAVRTYITGTGRQIIRNLVGHLNDPLFGKAEAQMYSEIFLLTASPAFLQRTIDSVVLTLRYDTMGVYGDLSQPVRLQVYLMEEAFNLQEDIRSDDAPMISAMPVAEAEIMPRPYDSLYIMSRGDSLRVPPMARIPMGAQFILALQAQDSATYQVTDSFRNFVKGLHVRMAPSADNTMLAFDMRSTWSRMTIYYNNGVDTFSNEIHFAFTDQVGFGVHHSRFTHDYSGSAVQEYLDDPSRADTLLFVQGMSGVNVEISVPGLPAIDNILLNKAELEFYVPTVSGDNLDFYPPVPQLVTARQRDNGYIELTDDARMILSQFGRLDFFGGNLTDVDSSAVGVKKYVMNVTTSLQDIYNGRTDDKFFIIPFLKPNVPNRVVLYGPQHAQYPARLRLYYTIVE